MAEETVFEMLREEIDRIPVIDTHEHLPNEADRLKQPVDFFKLFSHYCSGDLVAAGCKTSVLSNAETPLEEKWEQFAPYYDRIADGSYAHCAHLAMKKFYDMDRLESFDDAHELTTRIQQANKPGLYKKVLKDACNIVTSVNFTGTKADREFFTPVSYVSSLSEPCTVDAIRQIERRVHRSLTSLPRYVQAVAEIIEKDKAKGIKGLKFFFAYVRDLHFRTVPTADAERVFNRIVDETTGWRPAGLGYDEIRPLQDYLVHAILSIAEDLDLTAVFHTGIQAGNNNNLDNARPLRLWNLFSRYRKLRFNLLHAAMPWTAQAGMLAKYFKNVYVDMAWTYAISPSLSCEALKSFIDLVPRNKVLGFGGDYMVVEKVYGHLVLARQTIARALGEKVVEGALSEQRAIGWAKAMLHDNPIETYKLDIKPLS